MLCNNNNMKYIKMSTFIYVCELLFLTLCLPMSHTVSGDKTPICCVPEEWEGTMYLDYGTVFIDSNTAFSYINGTVRIAYSVFNKKIYLGIKGVEQSPLIPKPMPWDSEMLYDFSKGIMYNVVNNDCEKSQLDNMTQQCVPDEAELLSHGFFGGDLQTKISTFQYTTTSDISVKVRATVQETATQGTCKPIHVTYFIPSVNPDSGTMYSLDVLNIGKINSTDIFKVPKQCL